MPIILQEAMAEQSFGFPWEAPVKISVSSGTITGNKATDGNGICISGDNSKVKEAAKT